VTKLCTCIGHIQFWSWLTSTPWQKCETVNVIIAQTTELSWADGRTDSFPLCHEIDHSHKNTKNASRKTSPPTLSSIRNGNSCCVFSKELIRRLIGWTIALNDEKSFSFYYLFWHCDDFRKVKEQIPPILSVLWFLWTVWIPNNWLTVASVPFWSSIFFFWLTVLSSSLWLPYCSTTTLSLLLMDLPRCLSPPKRRTVWMKKGEDHTYNHIAEVFNPRHFKTLHASAWHRMEA